MTYDLFLFDADDTLFDFQASEACSFRETLKKFEIDYCSDKFTTYKRESKKLWMQLEQGETTKEYLQVERFRRTLKEFNIDRCPVEVNNAYLNFLPEFVHLIKYSIEICDFLSAKGEIGIITNGIESVQKRRLARSGLDKKISFMIVSEECGFVKPDKRFFEYTMEKAKRTHKDGVLVIGDRIETDILGAHQFGLHSCWFNPKGLKAQNDSMTYQIKCLSELKSIVG